MVRNSPVALRVLKASLNAAEDGYAGISELAGNATMLFYQTPEGKEVRVSSCCVWNCGSPCMLQMLRYLKKMLVGSLLHE